MTDMEKAKFTAAVAGLASFYGVELSHMAPGVGAPQNEICGLFRSKALFRLVSGLGTAVSEQHDPGDHGTIPRGAQGNDSINASGRRL